MTSRFKRCGKRLRRLASVLPLLRLYLVSTLLRRGNVQEAKRVLLRAKPLLPDWKEQVRSSNFEIVEMEKTP